MKQLSLEEVKEYFKNAKEVRCLFDKKVYDITNSEIRSDRKGCFQASFEDGRYCRLQKYNTEYAEILTYKEKTFSITESQINNLKKDIKNGYCTDAIYYLKKLFPEAFESEVKLETGKYYKHPDYPKFLTCLREDKTRFGIDVYGNWFDDGDVIKDEHQKDYVEATEQEVFEALKNEAVKRGLVKGEFIFPIDDEFNKDSSFKESIKRIGSISEIKNGKLYVLGYGKYCVFKDGQWAGIQQSITLSEAEQQLGKKIIV